MPPPLAFPVIWSTIGVLRAVSSVMIYQATGAFFSLPILAFIGHLCIGDTWNTINNVEKLKVRHPLSSLQTPQFPILLFSRLCGSSARPSTLLLISTSLLWPPIPSSNHSTQTASQGLEITCSFLTYPSPLPAPPNRGQARQG